ncbi:MAG: type II toxin-antitoxin system HicB family antitoxin [Bacteroidales bacterium]|jgi:predicted RNase H-like HicB family nuclease
MRIHKEKILHLPILIEQDEDNFYIVSCPTFEGCHSYGKTIDEALKNIQEVIEMCLEEQEEKKKKSSIINRFIGFRELQMPLRTATVKA